MLLRRFSRPLTWALPLALCAGLLLQPDAAAQAAKNGLLLCGNLVVPALFPFFILPYLYITANTKKEMSVSPFPFILARRCGF